MIYSCTHPLLLTLFSSTSLQLTQQRTDAVCSFPFPFPFPLPLPIRSLLQMSQLDPPALGAGCTEDELCEVKDSFSDVKRAFIEQQTQASFAKSLRGGASLRTLDAIFANLDANKGFAGEKARRMMRIMPWRCPW
jgi:hypothetical protein